MIPWNTIRPVLLALFGDLSGLQTVWQDKRRPMIDPKGQATVFLRVRSAVGIGVDDRRYTDLGDFPPPAAELEESANGHRRVSVEARVESLRHDDDRFAFNAAEALRTKLGFRSSLDRLRAVNVALVRAGQALDLPNVVQDDRVTSVAALELILNVGICTANRPATAVAGATHADAVQTIESVDNPVDHPNTVFNP